MDSDELAYREGIGKFKNGQKGVKAVVT